MWFGVVFKNRKSCYVGFGAAVIPGTSYGTVRCGSLLNAFFSYDKGRSVPILGKTVQNHGGFAKPLFPIIVLKLFLGALTKQVGSRWVLFLCGAP